MALIFESKMKVRCYECDSQGVVNNATYLNYFEATRNELLEKCGLRLDDLTKSNILPVVRNVNVSYRNSLHGSDEFVCTARIEKKGLRYFFCQDITRISDNIQCANAVIELVGLINGKVAKPDMFDTALAAYITHKD